jgi:hypothetical protein
MHVSVESNVCPKSRMITAGNQNDFFRLLDSQSQPLGEGEPVGTSDRCASPSTRAKVTLVKVSSRRALTERDDTTVPLISSLEYLNEPCRAETASTMTV